MMEAARTSEAFVNFYRTTRRYNLEGSHLSTNQMIFVVEKRCLWSRNWIFKCHVDEFRASKGYIQVAVVLEPDMAIVRVITFERDLFPRKEVIVRSPLRRCLGWLARARRGGTSLGKRGWLLVRWCGCGNLTPAFLFIIFFSCHLPMLAQPGLVHVAVNYWRRRKLVMRPQIVTSTVNSRLFSGVKTFFTSTQRHRGV
jgi:hypothetical protein